MCAAKIDVNDDEYPMNYSQPGTVVIFNNKQFSKNFIRKGSEFDVARIKETFKQLKFHVIVHEDLLPLKSKVKYSNMRAKTILVRIVLFVS